MQSCHEAYQVLLKVIRAKNKFIRKAAAAREQLHNKIDREEIQTP